MESNKATDSKKHSSDAAMEYSDGQDKDLSRRDLSQKNLSQKNLSQKNLSQNKLSQKDLLQREIKDFNSALINIIGLIIFLIDISLYFNILKIQLSGSTLQRIHERETQLIILLIVVMIFFLIQISYHLVLFGGKKAPLLQRVDRGSMLFLISALFTPILLNYGNNAGSASYINVVNIILVSILWIFAVAGMLLLIFKKNLSRALAPLLAFLSGIIGIIGVLMMFNLLNSLAVSLFIWGAILLISSGVVYVLKKPDLFPEFFGFHELFHTLLTSGAVVLFQLVKISLIA